MRDLEIMDGQELVVTDPAFTLEFNYFFKFKTQ